MKQMLDKRLTMNEAMSVGIDIGATKANLGLVTPSGKIIDSVRIPVTREASAEHFIATLCQAVRRLRDANHLEPQDITFYGVGVPGTADHKTGLVEYCPNLGWEDVPAGA